MNDLLAQAIQNAEYLALAPIAWAVWYVFSMILPDTTDRDIEKDDK